MACTRFKYDDARTIKALQQATDPGRWILNVPGNGANPAYMEDPQIIIQKWGGNLRTNTINLESELTRRENEIRSYRSFLQRSKDLTRKLIVADRLNESILRSREIKEQLNKCINSAKYWQQKGFENETSRSGSATTIKTNR